MNLLIQSAKIVDPSSPHNGKVMDILIENGIITEIKKSIPVAGVKKVVNVEGLHVSPGWFDMQASFCDPGYEYKENLQSGSKAAAAGGFTGVAVVPSTTPPVYSKSQVEYILSKTNGNIVDVYPIGAISHKLEGNHLAEMYDMKLSGAIAFSDDTNPVMNAGLMHRALLYAKSFNGLIMSRCNDKTLSTHSSVNEGKTSVMIGIKGEPSIAEEIMVIRDLFLAQHTEARIHINSVSVAGSLALIKGAKKQGLAVTASVNAYNLSLDDSAVASFDSFYKVDPPLRSKEDIKALKKALAEGIIDVICSDHRPEDEENKKVEFDLATPGMTGIQTLYPLVNMYSELTTEQIIEKIAINPRRILDLPQATIKEGSKANITLFNPTEEWVLTEKHLQSPSKNTPFTGKKLKGKIIGVVNNDKYQASEA
ncbi:MAG TPA: dihydroorotase [Bacteroidia bacterium]|jgi:dihydroorotase|nr:dihydroorotase [Bacteroidia bacterium]